MKNFFFTFLSLIFLFGCDDTPNNSDNCGDGVQDIGEECDGEDLGNNSCLTFGYYGGTLSCSSSCKIIDNNCSGYGKCGDGVIHSNFGEQCDLNELNNYTCESLNLGSGQLKCASNCRFDISGCEDGNVCGNGVVEDSENCDGENLAGLSCESLGLGKGDLICTDDCRIIATGCSGKTLCGDGEITPVLEDCESDDLGGKSCTDFGYIGGTLQCSDVCKFDFSNCEEPPKCGDGKINGDEDCDGDLLNSTTCQTLGYDYGDLVCGNDCSFDESGCMNNICGDNMATEAEDCDGADLKNSSCNSLGYYGGDLSCNDSCGFDISDCLNFGRCGDGVINSQYDEICDGTSLNNNSCDSFGLGDGTLSCNDTCTGFDFSNCSNTPICGDSILQQGIEMCDGTNIGTATCESMGYYGGIVQCNSNCTFDISLCTRCGDGILNGTEQCDNTDFGATSCSSMGLGGGSLTCNSDCTINTSNCSNTEVCGDGIITSPVESCDGTDLNGESCFDLGYYGGILSCNSSCQFDTTNCSEQFYCGDQTVQTEFSEECDGNNLNNTVCEDLGYYGGTLSCDASCNFNLSNCGTQGYCGDGIIQFGSGEECEAGLIGGQTCQNNHYTGGSGVVCTSCKLDYSNCNGWIKTIGTQAVDNGYLIEKDSQGNIYTVATSYDSMIGIFITKYSSDGTELWSTQPLTANNGFIWPKGVAFDYLDNLYVTGYTSGPFDGNSSNGQSDIIVFKYSSDGTKLWSLQYGSSYDDYGYDVTVSPYGELFVTGLSPSLDGISGAGGNDVFLTKFTTDGTKEWSVLKGSYENDIGTGIVTDNNGNIFIAGSTGSNAGITGTTNSGSSDIFLMKFVQNGYQAGTLIGSTEGEDITSITKDSSGFIYLCGYTTGDFDGHTNAGGKDIILLKYSPDLTKVWSVQSGDSNDDYCSGIAINETAIYITGKELTGNKVFIKKFDFNGALQWSKSYSSTLGIREGDITVHNNKIYITGSFSETFLGLTAIGDEDIFTMEVVDE